MRYQLGIVGGGPAGMMAALIGDRFGIKTILIDDNPALGGQLIKQTHKFFGSKDHYCGYRGFQIGSILREEIAKSKVEVITSATVTGIYPGFILGLHHKERYQEVGCDAVIVATGAKEKFLIFENNDLPGVYGAGAVQTLMNVYGVFPGRRALMIGSGNIGLIVTYQLLQAGVEVPFLVEILPEIGGWFVHAAKIARAGTRILTSHTIISALGEEEVEGAVIAKVDDQFHPVSGSEVTIDVDLICLAVGLSPLSDLLWQVGCRMEFIPELGGYLAWHNERMETTVPGLYVAGDVAGIEEATTAMLEGKVAAISAVSHLLGPSDELSAMQREIIRELDDLRSGDFSQVVSRGLRRLYDRP
ncbi:pyridine nucleotide-disulfide oxidoreductase [candidate division WOR-3 bacterium]|uniref:Pyridine nucleotide-disulfide oxidoreductase n=1 Tax=candidate division WOR-3 bacterium TaxID=2052148 RepID=A0A660SJW0_UNCW3|nr:MAG: pyridine nucleotide-disulfide oxidoreductase [candidate division WOR-3 bacterium]